MAEAPGRVCPIGYRYGAAATAGAPERAAETLYVVGGLYGNRQALDAIEVMAASEAGEVRICFNGDFNWFNIDDAGFRAINERVLRHDAILGNVEAEFAQPSDEAGCGCAYPANVDDEVVERSNGIHAILKRTAARHPDILARLGALPMVARYRIGGAAIGVVHGDAEALAGWRFDPPALDDPREQPWRDAAFREAKVDVFASTHTCLPATRRYGDKVVSNNGAAGMPNALATRFGILTRIGVEPSPHRLLYGCKVSGAWVDSLAIAYDTVRWEREFLRNWPEGSAAWLSYFSRIANGPEYRLQENV